MDKRLAMEKNYSIYVISVGAVRCSNWVYLPPSHVQVFGFGPAKGEGSVQLT
jgi:hypothetical protein